MYAAGAATLHLNPNARHAQILEIGASSPNGVKWRLPDFVAEDQIAQASLSRSATRGLFCSKGTRYLVAVISARIEMAISGGVLAPMNSPIGPFRRSICRL
jgi:hypothetical protein